MAPDKQGVLVSDRATRTEFLPVVSILCTAFNHERFLRRALDSFLMQRTSFPVEIVVHDDASTDGTPAIISEYAARFPGVVRSIAQAENQYSRGVRAIQLIAEASRGHFVAICDGDDYWTAEDKLESQVELLTSRPDASAAIHRADGLVEDSATGLEELIPGMFGPLEIKAEYGVDDLLRGPNFVPTSSILMRRELLASLPTWLNEVAHGDIVILCTAAGAGPLLYDDRSMSVYRKHGGGIHTGASTAMQILLSLNTLIVMSARFGYLHRQSYLDGTRFRIDQLTSEIHGYERSISRLNSDNLACRNSLQSVMTSRTFRVGRAISSLRDRITGLRPPRPADERP